MFLLRQLMVLLALLGLGWILRRVFQPARPRRPTARRETPPTPAANMVRDRICNTFLPQSEALTTRVGSEDHYFCSERCRSAFLAEKPRSQSGV